VVTTTTTVVRQEPTIDPVVSLKDKPAQPPHPEIS
jgi:hypothetical protein